MSEYDREQGILKRIQIREQILDILTGEDYWHFGIHREQITPGAKIEGDIFKGDYSSDNFVMDVETKLGIFIDHDFSEYLTEKGGTVGDLIEYIANGCRNTSNKPQNTGITENCSILPVSPHVIKKWWQIWKR